MTHPAIARQDAASTAAPSDLYRAVWRWHFYAGLLVLPFLITLSVTGALYLFRDEIETAFHAELKRVEPQQTETIAPSQLIANATAAFPGKAVKITTPPAPDLSAEVTVKPDGGEKRAVYLDPYSGQVLGSLPDRGTIMWTIRELHSLKFFGPIARSLIEIAAGWSILLVGTGFYLWWPRGQKGGVVSLRATPKRRIFWRDLHAVTGLFVGGFIIFLAITGMPWSNIWGGKVNEWANGSNFGYPSGVRVDVPMSDQKLADVARTSWSLEQAQIPESGATGGHEIGIDRAMAIFDDLGLHAGYSVNIPSNPSGVYTGSVYPDDLSQQRVVHLDQYSGKPLIDMSFTDYGPAGRWLEFGINTHMGQQFGHLNQWLFALVCAAIVMLSVSAAVMWWKRRPSRKLGVPPMPSDPRVFRGLLVILAIGGVIFPLVGISLLVMLAFDWLIRHATQASRRPREA